MIKNINLKFGSAPNLEHASIAATPVTVFVGPNNSGKSKILEEVFQFCNTGEKNINSLILEDIEFENFSSTMASQEIEAITLKPHMGEAVNPGHVIVGKKQFRDQVPIGQLLSALQNPNAHTNTNLVCQ